MLTDTTVFSQGHKSLKPDLRVRVCAENRLGTELQRKRNCVTSQRNWLCGTRASIAQQRHCKDAQLDGGNSCPRVKLELQVGVQVEIEIEYTPAELRLFVRDDGRGMDPEVVHGGISGHWGIAGMKERAERIGGTLTIRSRVAAGTEIELRVPGRAAFNRGGTAAAHGGERQP